MAEEVMLPVPARGIRLSVDDTIFESTEESYTAGSAVVSADVVVDVPTNTSCLAARSAQETHALLHGHHRALSAERQHGGRVGFRAEAATTEMESLPPVCTAAVSAVAAHALFEDMRTTGDSWAQKFEAETFDPAVMVGDLDLCTFTKMLDAQFANMLGALQETLLESFQDLRRKPSSIYSSEDDSECGGVLTDSFDTAAFGDGSGMMSRASSLGDVSRSMSLLRGGANVLPPDANVLPTRASARLGFKKMNTIPSTSNSASEPDVGKLRTVDFEDSPSNIGPSAITQQNSAPAESVRGTTGTSGLFGDGRRCIWDYADVDDMKVMIRQNIIKADGLGSDVTCFYKDDGFFQKIARAEWFENLTLVVIVLNACWIAVDVDLNGSSSLYTADPIFIIVAHFFCEYFLIELIIRFCAFKRKSDIKKDYWFLFDSCLVVMMIAETWMDIQSMMQQFQDTVLLRLIKLARLTRVVRMLRSLPELNALVKGMVAALRSVMYVMVLLCLITYIFAVAFCQLSEGYSFRETYFKGVGLSMYSLVVYGTFLDNLTELTEALRAESMLMLMLFFIFVILACMTVMNMLVGVLCEVISAVAATEKEELRTRVVTQQMSRLVSDLSINAYDGFSLKEFQQLMSREEAIVALNDAGVDPLGLVDMAPLLFFENGSQVDMPFERFMELVLDLRGSNKATVKDIMNLSRQVGSRLDEQTTQLDLIAKELPRMSASLQSRLNKVMKAVAERVERVERLSNVHNVNFRGATL
eukprot:TRINITY_DN65038_c0_g1_i3.p1 TRINITY_DN65038_c0_g1~~TRINITY_DN65038_c0_g1_i3.p1  ORF type:complete len:756 (-),score=156.91 TRINITY_DN65038_c0_g1_i3:825-3092(-)